MIKFHKTICLQHIFIYNHEYILFITFKYDNGKLINKLMLFMNYAYDVVKFQIINHLSETVQIHTSSP